MDSYYDDGGCCIVHPDSTNLILTGGKGPLTQTNWSFVVSYSRDGGSKWTRCNPTPASAGFCHALAVAPSQTNVIYAGGEVAGAGAVYRSTDLGSTWTRTTTAPTDTVFSLEVDPTDAARVLAATPDGAFLTTNSGETWTNLHGGNLRVALRYPGKPDTLLGGGYAGVSISTDGGNNWSQLNAGLDGRAVTALAFADHNGDYLVAGTVGGSCYAWQFDDGIIEAWGAGRGAGSQIQAWPNPFGRVTAISYELSIAGTVALTVHDATGKAVRRLASGPQLAGFHSVDWDGRDDAGRVLPAGVYFVRFSAGDRISTGRLTLIR